MRTVNFSISLFCALQIPRLAYFNSYICIYIYIFKKGSKNGESVSIKSNVYALIVSILGLFRHIFSELSGILAS